MSCESNVVAAPSQNSRGLPLRLTLRFGAAVISVVAIGIFFARGLSLFLYGLMLTGLVMGFVDTLLARLAGETNKIQGRAVWLWMYGLAIIVIAILFGYSLHP